MDLTEAEDIKKRWQEYTEELYKKDLQDPDNHEDMFTNLEPDILESEVAQLCLTLCDPIDCSYQAPVSMGFSRQEYWSGMPLPSPIYVLEYDIYLSLSDLLHSV